MYKTQVTRIISIIKILVLDATTKAKKQQQLSLYIICIGYSIGYQTKQDKMFSSLYLEHAISNPE